MKTAIFSGTSDGKELCSFFEEMNIKADVFVATEYGRYVMPDFKTITVFTGRLTENEMIEKLAEYNTVIDATHPYATEVSKNIKNACVKNKIAYLRLLREISCDEIFTDFNCIEDAVSYLKDKNGNVFVSTGSKEIEKFTLLHDYKNSVYGRCLDSEAVISKCLNLGFKAENFIFRKGPFAYEENLNAFKTFDIKYLVTKQTGKNGGFAEKIKAAQELGIEIILIKPPIEEKGYSISEIKEIIQEKYNIGFKFPMFVNISRKKVVVIGCGNIAARRIKVLSEFNADVVVIADEIKNTEIKNFKNVTLIKRNFIDSDLENAFLAVSATDNREVNHRVYEICKEKNIPVSIADSREESTFFFPAICKNEDIIVGLTSNGSNHSIVRRTAEKIRRLICGKN